MGTIHPYERSFDEDVQQPTSACPECDGRVTTNTHETVCDDCGLVLAAGGIDPGAEGYAFRDGSLDETLERTGPPRTPRRHDSGLSTVIGWKRDGRGDWLSGERRAQFSRLRRQHSRANFDSKREYFQAEGLGEVRRLVAELELGRGLRDQACALFSSAHGAGLATGRSVAAVAAVAVYATCRVNDLPWTQEDLLGIADCERSLFRKTLVAVRDELGLELAPRNPAAFVPRLVSADDATETVMAGSTALARSLDTEMYNGSNPAGVAAACVYAVVQQADIPITQTELAAAADVSTVTIRSHWQEIRAGTDVGGILQAATDRTAISF
jgi:transcription initiation factor TFIIB